jgi:hypothetical protein
MATFCIGLTQTTRDEFENDNTLCKKWFGGSMIHIKRDAHNAIHYMVQSGGTFPVHIVSFTMPLQTFHRLVDSGQMKAVLHVDGYRVYEDLFVDRNDGWAYDIEVVEAAPVPAVGDDSQPDLKLDDEAAPVPVDGDEAPAGGDDDIIPVDDDEAPAGEQPFALAELVKPGGRAVKHPVAPHEHLQ